MRVVHIFLIFGFFADAAISHAAPCDGLKGEQQKLAKKIFAATYPYDCCDETLERCLKQKKVCKLAKRLRDNICRRISKGQNKEKIKNSLNRRARSMMPLAKKGSFDLARAPMVGNEKAKVSVVVYACSRCPFCARVVPEVHRLATQSALKNKIKVYYRPFPIRNHPGALEGGQAFIAAAKLNKFWPYLLKVFAEYNHFSGENLVKWAGQLGMDQQAFRKAMSANETREQLVKSKKEGLRNGVDATPTLFINGRKYYGELGKDTLIDILEEEVDRVSNKQYCEK